MVISFFSRKGSASGAASSISTDTTNFDTFLGPADTDVQKALDTIDDHIQTPTTGGTGIVTYNPGDIIYADGYDSLTTLPVSAEDRILKIVGGVPFWDDNIDGGEY